MSKIVHGHPCWGCEHFNPKTIDIDKECDGNEHEFCEQALAEHDAKIREDAINEYKYKLLLDVTVRAQSFENIHDKYESEIYNYATRIFIKALQENCND